MCNISLVHLLDTLKSLVVGNLKLLQRQADTTEKFEKGNLHWSAIHCRVNTKITLKILKANLLSHVVVIFIIFIIS